MTGAALVAAAVLVSSQTAAAKAPLRAGERIDLNRATIAELMRLPDIGRKRAERIVELRGRKPFRRVDDVAAVPGISPRWIARNRPVLAIGAAREAGAVGSASLDRSQPVR